MVPNRVVVGSTQLGEAFLQLLKRGYVMYSLANDALALESRMRLEIGADLDQAALDKLDSKTIAKALDLISLKKNDSKCYYFLVKRSAPCDNSLRRGGIDRCCRGG